MRFRWWYPILNRPNSPWGWLAPLIVIPFIGPPLPPAPWGWRYLRLIDRRAVYLLPLWLYWPVQAWRFRWWALEPLLRVGILKLRDGDYWSNARWWCWNAERAAGWKWVKTGEWT